VIANHRRTSWSVAAFAVASLAAIPMWWIASAVIAGVPAGGTGWLAIACAILLLLSIVAGVVETWIPPAALVVFAVWTLIRDPAGALSSSPLDGPFGYVNAEGAFFGQAAFAALLVAAVWRGRARVLPAAAAVAFALVPFLAHSYAAGVLLLVMAPIALALGSAGRGRTAAHTALGAVCFSIIATAVLASGIVRHQMPGVYRASGELLSYRRLALWGDALEIIAEHPMVGTGPETFSVVSPTARTDPDARWTHNEFLQAGAETGIPGLVIVVGVFVALFLALSISGDGVVVAVAAAALAAVGVQASIDYILHFPAVPLAAVAIVGAAIGANLRRHPHGIRA